MSDCLESAAYDSGFRDGVDVERMNATATRRHAMKGEPLMDCLARAQRLADKTRHRYGVRQDADGRYIVERVDPTLDNRGRHFVVTCSPQPKPKEGD